MLKKISLLLILIVTSSLAQSNIFQPYDVFRTNSVDETVVSPDNNFVAFTLRVPRPFTDKQGTAYKELYIYDYSKQTVHPLLTGKVSINNISFTIDSKRISFTSMLNGNNKSQIFTIPVQGGEAVQISESPNSIIFYAWHPKKNQIAYIAEEKKPKLNHEKLGFDIEVFEENLPGRYLYLLNPETKKSEKLVTDGAVFSFKWSPNGNKIAAGIAPNNLVDDKYMFTRIYIVDAITGEKKKLVDNPGKLGNYAWSKNGKHLAFISSADKNDAVDGSLFITQVPGIIKFENLKNYSKGFIGSVTDIHWLDDDTFIFVSEEGVYTTLRKQKITDEKSEILIKPGQAVFNSISVANNMLVFAGETPSHPKELYTFNLSSGLLNRNTFNNKWLNEINLAEQKVVEYTASDGLNIQGLLFYPVDYEKGKRYPLIIYVHGGPESTNSYGWNTAYNKWGQSAAGKDFFVFMPNYRAGSGRGNEFTMMGFADAGGREFIDIIDGIEYLNKQGLIDKNKVGIGGGSYGGYFSAWAASKHTEHFAAAVSFVGIGNQLAKRNTTDIPWESYLVHWGYWVNENPMTVYERSPVRYAEQMNTPLLILHGTKDPRVHPSQSLEMYRAFSLRGNAPVRLVWYEGEEHGNSKNTNRLDYHLRTLEWFEYYLKENNSKEKLPSNEIEYNLDYFE